MSAVIVADEDLGLAAALLTELRRDLNRRPGDTLHWKNIKDYSARLYAVTVIGAAPFLTISTVIVCKRRFRPSEKWATDDGTYSQTLYLLLQRLSWYCRDEGGMWEGQRSGGASGTYRPGLMTYTLAHIVRYKMETLRALEAELRQVPVTKIAWPSLDPRGGRLEQPSKVELLQLADIVVSATAKACEPEEGSGNTDRSYIEQLEPRLYRRWGGQLSSYGMKCYPSCGDDLAWVNKL